MPEYEDLFYQCSRLGTDLDRTPLSIVNVSTIQIRPYNDSYRAEFAEIHRNERDLAAIAEAEAS